MPGERLQGAERPVVFCVIPRELAAKLHEPLREHFRDDPAVRVVIERRGGERRTPERRVEGDAPAVGERRRIRSQAGRRVAERRARIEQVPARELPRRLRRYADAVEFVERLEPSTEHLMDIDTAHLVIRAQGSDASAFREIYLRYFDAVYAYARVVLNDGQEAEDVAQEIFANVFQALPRYVARPGKPFRAWLFRIARNEAVDRMKKLGMIDVEEPESITRRVELEEPQARPFILDWGTDGELLFLIERLPLPQRQALALRYIVGLSAKEIAAVMGRTPEGVAQLQYRARRFLEQRLTALRQREESGARRTPMLIRLRRMPVLRARRAPVAMQTVSSSAYGAGVERISR